jgi:hypothetical protein
MSSQAQRARELGITPAAMTKRIKRMGYDAAMAMPRQRSRRPRIVPAAETTRQPAHGVIRAAYRTDLSTMWPERNMGEFFRIGATAAAVAAALARREK